MIIGITTTLIEDLSSERVNTKYLERIKMAGGIPILLPPLDKEADIDSLFSHLHGILLSGGGDIDPLFYDDTVLLKETGFISRERDLFEFRLIRKAHEAGIPLLGICRGMQAINVAMGGSLYQDILACGLTSRSHFQEKPYERNDQVVTILPDTLLATIYPDKAGSTYHVNSIHHQTIKNVAPGLHVNAMSGDGLIEGIEDPTKTFFVGVQWHPEYLQSDAPLFEAFCRAVKKHTA